MRTTLDPVASALRAIPRQELRCIGQYPTDAGPVDYPVGWADADRDTAWVRGVLGALGVRSGDFVAVVSTGHEAPWYAPVLDAVNGLRATVCPLEPAGFELGRAQMFFRRFPISSVIGLDTDLGGALAREGDLAGLLRPVRFVLARPEAHHLVDGQDIATGLIAPIGPALGLACASAGLVHVDESQWRIDQRDGELAVTAVADRAHRAESVGIGAPATLAVEHRCPCGHGTRALRPARDGAAA